MTEERDAVATEARDAIVIGAGPAGMAAATLLARHGASVLLLDEQATPGGQIYRGIELASPRLRDVLGPDYRHGAGLTAALRDSGAEFCPQSTVWQVTPEREIWFTRADTSGRISASVVIVAVGAMERPVPVPGWTLPGVMMAGGVQALLKTAALRPAPGEFVLAGAGPLLWLVAAQCLAAGSRPAAVLDTNTGAAQLAALRLLPRGLRGAGWRYLAKGLTAMAAVQRAGVPIHRAAHDLTIEAADGTACAIRFAAGGSQHRIATRLVALHEGVIPAQQMTRAIGCEHEWDAAARCFRPTADASGWTSVPGVLVAGDAAGIGGARAAEHAGRLAALAALHRLGRLDAAARDRLAAPERQALASHRALRPFLDALYAPPAAILTPADDVAVCRCEEVTAGAIRAAVRQGCLGPNQAKAFLRAGMGPCQGRMCGPVVSEIIAAERGVSVAETGFLRIRPPIKPITLGELAALEPGPVLL
ncbi:MAG TPA: (2Fe-2S)-binding protein [Acetobacteraceae bacterium]|nr:(2Fe-2S)-binding protein [Acetobacteraceae bacterium]